MRQVVCWAIAKANGVGDWRCARHVHAVFSHPRRRAAHQALGGRIHWDGKGGRSAHRLHTGGVVGGDPSCYRCECCMHAVLGDRQRVGPSHSGWEGQMNIQCHGCVHCVRAVWGQPDGVLCFGSCQPLGWEGGHQVSQ